MFSLHGCHSEASTCLLGLIISVLGGPQRSPGLPRFSVCGELGPTL